MTVLCLFAPQMLISSQNPADEAALAGTQRLPVWGDVSENRDIFCVPANSSIEMFAGDGVGSPASQQDVYSLPGENCELTVGRVTLPGSKKKGSRPITITSRKQTLNTTRPQTCPTPSVACTPFLSNRTLLQKEFRRDKKYSEVSTPAVLAPNAVPLHMSDKYLISKKETAGSDFNAVVQQSRDIADMFE